MKKWQLKSKHRMEEKPKSNKNSIIILVSITVIIVGLFGIILILSKNKSDTSTLPQAESETSVNNVSMVDGKQVIEIAAKVGYTPRKSVAKANVPTVIKVKTNDTYDCSIAVRIPSLKLSKNMAATDEVVWDVGPQPEGKLVGNCSMGMYFFEIDFQA